MDYKDLEVYKLALQCFTDTVNYAKEFPKTEIARIIINQLLRSVSSISANIAEGYGRRKGKEYIQFLYIARGSTTESIDWYEKLKLLNYIDENIYKKQTDILEHIRASLTKMINNLSKNL